MADRRGGRVVFLSHCLLNENVRYPCGAGRPAGVTELVDGYLADGVGIVQLPCPEQRAWGGVEKRLLLPMYGSDGSFRHRWRRPLVGVLLLWTRVVAARLARGVVRDIVEHREAGVEVVGFVGVGPSPTCGVHRTIDCVKAADVLARYALPSTSCGHFNRELHDTAAEPGEGVFVGAVRRRLVRRGLEVPFVEHDLIAELRESGLLQ